MTIKFPVKTPAQILQEARDILAEGRWIQGEFEENKNGIPCFCSLGAIAYVTSDHEEANWDTIYLEIDDEDLSGHPLIEATNFLAAHIPEDNVPVWNDDDITLDDVLEAFDAAIQAAHNNS